MNDTLEKIVTEINNNSVEIETCSLLARDNGRKALDLAIKTGGLLCQCKELLRKANQLKSTKGGQVTGWETWFDSNVKGFTVRTGQYYIKLYKTNTKRVSFFDDCESIREALQKIKDEDTEQTTTVLTEQQDPVALLTENIKEPTVTAPVTPIVDAKPKESGFKKKVKSKVTSLVNMFRKHRLEQNTETVALLLPIVQLWNERPMETVTLDGGRVFVETEPKEETETATTE